MCFKSTPIYPTKLCWPPAIRSTVSGEHSWPATFATGCRGYSKNSTARNLQKPIAKTGQKAKTRPKRNEGKMSKKRRVSLTPLRAGIQTTYQTSRRAPVQVGGGGGGLPAIFFPDRCMAGPFILSREIERKREER